MTKDPFRHALAQQMPLLMAWVTSGVPYVVEQMGEAGWDIIAVGTDMGLLTGAASDVIEALKG